MKNKIELIDKSAIVAEIEKVADEPAPSHDQQCPWEDGYYCGLYKVMLILDTLEVKEVDLEKEVHSQMDLLCNLLCYMDELSNGASEGIYPLPEKVIENLQRFAKHFFELGLKMKGE